MCVRVFFIPHFHKISIVLTHLLKINIFGSHFFPRAENYFQNSEFQGVLIIYNIVVQMPEFQGVLIIYNIVVQMPELVTAMHC